MYFLVDVREVTFFYLLHTDSLAYYPADTTPEEMLRLVRSEKFEFPAEQWDMISDSAKDLVRGLLTVDHRRRFTVRDGVMMMMLAV